jgi:broad-specificity NMP kinase
MKILFGGVNGSGKSTLLELVSKALGYPVIYVSGEFMHHMGYGTDYERLRAIPNSVRDEKLSQFMKELLHVEGNALFDSHYLNLVRGNISDVTGDWIKDVDALVLVSAPIEIVWQRITLDSGWRDRALFPKDTEEKRAKEMLVDYQKKDPRKIPRASRQIQTLFH